MNVCIFGCMLETYLLIGVDCLVEYMAKLADWMWVRGWGIAWCHEMWEGSQDSVELGCCEFTSKCCNKAIRKMRHLIWNPVSFFMGFLSFFLEFFCGNYLNGDVFLFKTPLKWFIAKPMVLQNSQWFYRTFWSGREWQSYCLPMPGLAREVSPFLREEKCLCCPNISFVVASWKAARFTWGKMPVIGV